MKYKSLGREDPTDPDSVKGTFSQPFFNSVIQFIIDL